MNIESPVASSAPLVLGKPLENLPQDLYIPPEALKIFLEAFEGPFDLLLYLVKKQNINILNISIADITNQYMQYIELMKELKIELAAEYLVMAGTLAEIKSRMLLPKPTSLEMEEDPSAELLRKLQEYERFKKAAEKIDEMPRLNRDIFHTEAEFSNRTPGQLPRLLLRDLWGALQEVLVRAEMFSHHHIKREMLSTREKMTKILADLSTQGFMLFEDLFVVEEGRTGVIVTFVAILELLRQAMIELIQVKSFGKIHVKKV